MKQKRLILFALLFLIPGLFVAQAQQSINASGGNASGSGGSVSYSIGQVAFQSYSGPTGKIAEGVQQAFEIWGETGVAETNWINLLVSAFPNPTTDFLTLSIKESDLSNLWFQLFDISGKILQSQKITDNQTAIEMTNLIPMTYFVRVIRENKEIKTFKIIKN